MTVMSELMSFSLDLAQRALSDGVSRVIHAYRPGDHTAPAAG